MMKMVTDIFTYLGFRLHDQSKPPEYGARRQTFKHIVTSKKKLRTSTDTKSKVTMVNDIIGDSTPCQKTDTEYDSEFDLATISD
jgi:hypothetical protein